MGFFDRFRETRSSPETISSSVTPESLLAYFNMKQGALSPVTIDSALTVPAVNAGVSFLSSTLASLPLHAYRDVSGTPKRLGGPIQRLLNEAPNDDWSSYAARKYFWQQVFTGGRGLFWVERSAAAVVALWPMDPTRTTVRRNGVRKVYTWTNGTETKTYDAADVVDVPFMLKADQLNTYSPIMNGSKAIQLALALNDYASVFFAGGGVPPLSLEGPMPTGGEAMKRMMADVNRAIDGAKADSRPVFPMPPGYTLKPVGFDPAKGQMTDARRFQIEEIARLFSLPPVFLQDLTHGTFSNSEQQDLHLVKHLVAQWASAFEDELNLKLFGAASNSRYVEHNLDGLMRGDFKSRMEALASGVNTALITPNEARALDNREPKSNGDDLYIQGATVKLGTQAAQITPPNGGDSAPGADQGANQDGA